jgi:hypothetical protein
VNVVGRWLLISLLLAGSSAHAQEPSETAPDPFPAALPDRPLVLPCGATELEISEELRTYVQTTTDMMGNVTRERSGFFDDRTPDLRVSHSFRNVEVLAFIGLRAGIEIAVDTFGIPRVVKVGAAFSNVQRDGRYNHSQYANIQQKLLVVPGRLSIVSGATVSMTEALGYVDAEQVEGGIVSASLGASAYAQLAGPFAASVGAGVGAPLWQSEGFRGHADLSVDAYLHLAWRRWDVYAGGNLFDVTRPGPSTFLSAGFKKRWGL